MEELEHFLLSTLLLSLTEIRRCLQKLLKDTEMNVLCSICTRNRYVVAKSDIRLKTKACP